MPPRCFPSIVPVCHDAAKNAPSGLSIGKIADAMQVNYHTLMSELSGQRGHKLGADHLLPLIQLTQSPDIMNFLARELGGVFALVPGVRQASPERQAPQAPLDQNLLVDSLLACVREFGEFAAEVSTDIADGKLPRQQFDRILREGQEAMSAILQMMELARKTHEHQYGNRL